METVFVSEFDCHAVTTYRANFDSPKDIAGDITEVDAGDIPAFDICLAGFPCQAFSIAGGKKGFDDDYKGMSRGTLFFDVARICEYHQPKVVFCENVKGLPMHRGGRTLQVILGTLDEIGYAPFCKVLNSKDFGVPQNRERIYIVAFRKDIAPDSFEFPEGTGESSTIREKLEPAPIPSKYYLSDRYLSSLREHKARHQKAGNGFGYVVRDLDGIAGALVCGGMGRERNLIIDSRPHSMVPTTNIKGPINVEDIRKMTPREWASLQGFPEGFRLNLADTHLYRQLGNSVTVPVVREIARCVKEVVCGQD